MNPPFQSSSTSSTQASTSESKADAKTPLPFSVERLNTVDRDELAQYAPLATQILDDPVAMRQVSDRVFELLCQDLRLQQERRRGYGR